MSVFFSSRRRHTRFDCDWSSDVCSSDLGEFRMGVEASPHRGAANREIVEPVESDSHAAAVAVEQADVAGKFLPHRERRGVLQMRAADLDYAGEGLGFAIEIGRAHV